MHNPTHPGEVLRDWLPEQITVTQAAKELQVSRVTLSKCIKILFRLRKLIYTDFFVLTYTYQS